MTDLATLRAALQHREREAAEHAAREQARQAEAERHRRAFIDAVGRVTPLRPHHRAEHRADTSGPRPAAEPLQRLAEVHRRMEHIKHSPEVLITSAMAEGIGHLHAVEKPFVDFFAGKAVGVTTNVVGPREPRYLAGVEVTGVLGWVPGSGGQTLGVCIFSYAGTVRIGFKVDAATVPEPQRLVRLIEAELESLRDAAAAGP